MLRVLVLCEAAAEAVLPWVRAVFEVETAAVFFFFAADDCVPLAAADCAAALGGGNRHTEQSRESRKRRNIQRPQAREPALRALPCRSLPYDCIAAPCGAGASCGWTNQRDTCEAIRRVRAESPRPDNVTHEIGLPGMEVD